MFESTEVSFRHDDTLLAGTVTFAAATAPGPGVVMLQGSGAVDRDNGGYFPAIRDYLVAQGVTVLCYDKPGVGASPGDWTRQSFLDRAQEALAALDCLQQFDQVDAQRVGLWGHSQGGWIVYLAASMSEEVAWVIANSGPGVSLVTQDRYGLTYRSQQAGEAAADIQQALDLYDDVIAVHRRDGAIEEILALIAARQNAVWQQYFGEGYRAWAFHRLIFDYDPRVSIAKTHCPVLALFGAEDVLLPVKESVSVIQQTLAGAGNSAVTMHVFADADHRIGVGGALAPGYLAAMGEWLRRHLVLNHTFEGSV